MKLYFHTITSIRNKKQISNYILLLVVLLISSSSLKAQVPSYVPTNGLVSWWPFNGNANDESGNGNNGTVNGATLTGDRFGNINSAFYFSSINCSTRIDANVNTSTIQSGVTISVWVKRSGNGCLNPRILEFYPGTNGPGIAQWVWNYSNQGQTNSISVGLNTSTNFNSYSLINNPSTTDWIQLVYTNDGINGKVYYNGILSSTIPSIGNPILASNLAIGRMNHPYNDAFEGNIDDIGIWNRALTQQEINILYNGCSPFINYQPLNQNVHVNNNAQFIVSSSAPNSTYQWQINMGTGFQNINNGGQYNGANNDTLTVYYVTYSNNNKQFRCIVTSGSCSDTSNVAVLTVNNNVGINEISQNQLFSVYPNPTSTVIHLKSDAQLLGATYFIYDNLGKIILSGKVTSENMPIDLNQLAEGNYLIGIESDGIKSKKQSIKVIK